MTTTTARIAADAVRFSTPTGRELAAESLRVLLPVGATVAIVIEDHRRNRAGTSATRILALGTITGIPGAVVADVVNLSAWVGRVTGDAVTHETVAYGARVTVKGHGSPVTAAGALVADLARALHGSSTALTWQVI